MHRRMFLAGFGALAISACRMPWTSELDLPGPVQVNQPERQVAPGMTGLATFSAKVLVLRRRDYPVSPSDTLSAVSPTDLAVAWGPAARSPSREAVQLTQSDRRYNWRARTSDMHKPGVGTFTRYSGNWHMVPATPDVAQALRAVHDDDVIQVEGDLVQVTFTNGVYYRSSMLRDDVGDGACEILRVTSLTVERTASRV